MKPRTICLMNDSFPPIVDGVANATLNYASYYEKNFGRAIVATPYHPEADDSSHPFPVIRYRSFNTTRFLRYRTGYPFSVDAMRQIRDAGIELIHSHCPFMSTFLARAVRDIIHVPVVFTYHTKFDIDIARTTSSETIRKQAVRMILNNIGACDEVWTVSRGAGENLRSLGYQGEYIIMENGVDYPRGRLPEQEIRVVTGGYPLPEETPVYLFVGRMMWYKGLRLVFDGLQCLMQEGHDFRFLLIGGGSDRKAMEDYAAQSGLEDKCLFLGEIRDRETLRAWYCRASLFLFPSTYDTNGLVVREAASCGLASLLIKDSCAAEGVTDGLNGFLCEENPLSLAAVLSRLYEQPEAAARAGEHAMEQLYLSWEDSVARAAQRYEVILEHYPNMPSPRRHLTDEFIHTTADVMEGVELLREFRQASREELLAMYNWQKEHLGRLTDRLWSTFRRKR